MLDSVINLNHVFCSQWNIMNIACATYSTAGIGIDLRRLNCFLTKCLNLVRLDVTDDGRQSRV